jgi:hypothetical protein
MTTKKKEKTFVPWPKQTVNFVVVKKPSLWQRLKEKVFGGEGRVDDLFK